MEDDKKKLKKSLGQIDLKSIPKKMSAGGVVNMSPEPIINSKISENSNKK